jgi:hypothetical protein
MQRHIVQPEHRTLSVVILPPPSQPFGWTPLRHHRLAVHGHTEASDDCTPVHIRPHSDFDWLMEQNPKETTEALSTFL